MVGRINLQVLLTEATLLPGRTKDALIGLLKSATLTKAIGEPNSVIQPMTQSSSPSSIQLRSKGCDVLTKI